ncbi:glycosyltransferase family 4 protein [Rhodococcus sp. 14-2483-1-2]|uniref:glycosyltransferase family 4 protein n=1 Tax=Rhodococcus sp. 14-2483-1-2 TaxID=2023147 RepID=UPI0014828415|nr:glycosyltransferase family 4 protein [Rhodococcus sp. 14-2483-1-2]
MTESASVWGAEHSLLILLEQFKQQGIEATTVLAQGSPFKRILDTRNHRAIEYRFAKHPALAGGSFSTASRNDIAKEPFNVLASGVRLAKVLKDFDLALSFSLWQSPETIIASRIRRIPCVLDLHETFSGGQSVRLTKFIGNFCSGVIAPSLSIVRSSGLTLSPKVRVIGRPVEVDKTTNQHRNARLPLTVGIFGQIVPHKGVHQLVSAVEAMPQGALNLMVVGGTKEADRRTPFELDLRERVSRMPRSQFLDRVGAVGPYMRKCDLVVNLSEHEAFGRTVVEAISCGAYPVVLDGSGPAEIVNATGVGKVIESVEDLEGFLISLCGPGGMVKLDELFRDRAHWPDAVDQFAARSVGERYAAALKSFA